MSVRVKIRFYCPECGEVRGNEKEGFPREHDGVRIVFAHKRAFYGGAVMCPGGAVDPVKDRAP